MCALLVCYCVQIHKKITKIIVTLLFFSSELFLLLLLFQLPHTQMIYNYKYNIYYIY